MNEVVLRGCRATTVAGYLQALGLLRVLAEQRDPTARGRWSDDTFVLTTELNSGSLLDWLIDDYAPSPIVSPWNAGSGFAGNGKSPAAERALTTIRDSASPRFSRLRAGIMAGERVMEAGRRRGWGGSGDKLWAEAHKADVIRLCRNMMPDQAVSWLDATVALTSADPQFNPLAGTGGNFGRQDLSATFLQRLLVVAGEDSDRARSRRWAEAALLGREGVPYLREAVGQYDPGRAGGIHSSPWEKTDDKGFANPWSGVLVLEGVLLFASAVVRRTENVSRGALPFLVRSSPVGYGSAADGETVKGELWAPVWDRPAGLSEVEHLFGEGRAEWRGRQAADGLDFAFAIVGLGVDRNLRAFHRFVIAERLGQNPLAVSVGQVAVRGQREQSLLRDPYNWVQRVRRTSPPSGVLAAVRRVEQALFDIAARGDRVAWRRFVVEFGRLHDTVSRSGGVRDQLGPYQSTRRPPDWLAVLGDDDAEIRLAAAFASLHDASFTAPERAPRSLLARARYQRDDAGRIRVTWADAPRTGVDLVGNTVTRALAEAHRQRALPPPGPAQSNTEPARRNGYSSAYHDGLWVRPELIDRFVAGETDDELTGEYLRGLLALGCSSYTTATAEADPRYRPTHPALQVLLPFFGSTPFVVRPSRDRTQPPDGARLPFRLTPQPDWTARLIAGRTSDVVADALLRLRMAHCHPVLTADALSDGREPEGVRLAAGLLLAVAPDHRAQALSSVCAVAAQIPADKDHTDDSTDSIAEGA